MKAYINKIITKTDLVVTNIEKIVLIVSGYLITILTFLSAINRYFIKLSLPWIEELTIVCYMFLVFYGISNIEKDDAHLRVTYLESKLTNYKKISFLQGLYIKIVSLFILLLGIIFGYSVVITTTRKTTYLSLPYSSILFLTYWIGFVFYAFRVFSKIYFIVKKEVS